MKSCMPVHSLMLIWPLEIDVGRHLVVAAEDRGHGLVCADVGVVNGGA